MQLADYRILVTDNDIESASRVMGILGSRGMQVELVSHPPRLAAIQAGDNRGLVTLVVISGGVHEQSTMRFLEGLRQAPASLGVICLIEPTEPRSFHSSTGWAWMRSFEKPVQGEEVVQAVTRLIERKRLIGKPGLSVTRPRMREVIERVAQYSQVNSTVLIPGESGTGKELVAQAIHTSAPAGTNLLSRSIAAPSRRECWKASCSGMRRARSPGPPPAQGAFRVRGRRLDFPGRDGRDAASGPG